MLAEKIFGYARVSSKEQNLDRQIDELKKYVPNSVDIITEKQSGKDFDRPEYKKLRMMMRSGDTLYLMSLDRLGRNKLEVKQELENLRAAGLIEVLSTIAESERRTIRKRQAEGIAAARARGKHLGRPQVEFPNNWIAVYQRWQDKEITAVQAMEELDVKKTSFYNLVRRYKKSRGESYHSNNPIIPRSDTH